MKTVFFTLLALMTAPFAYSAQEAQKIDITSHPTLGNPKSQIQVVAFLEPKCPDSKRYNNESFGKLKSEFIDNNQISYTVITTSFLPQSMPAAVALLSVYCQDPNKPNASLFFKYLDYIYKNQPPERDNWATIDRLQQFASSASPEINLINLKSGIVKELYRPQIEKNTALGNALMGRLSTPTIYVNGIKVENNDDTIDYENLKTAINQATKQK